MGKWLVLLAFLSSASAFAGWTKESAAGVDFWLYVPKSGSPTHSLMLNLHGCAQTADNLKQEGNWEDSAEANHMVVAIPFVPHGGVIFGCWNYYGKDQNAGNKDNAPLLALTQNLLARADLKIDAANVYVSGISSGAAQAMLLGCMRPDLFRGVGLVGSPAVGTNAMDVDDPHSSPSEVASFCRKLSDGRAFDGQKMSVFHADFDTVVNPAHSKLIVKAMVQIYGLSSADPEQQTLENLAGTNLDGFQKTWTDAAGRSRLSLIVNENISHAWPAGSGSRSYATDYIIQSSVDYPAFLSSYFAPALPEAPIGLPFR